MDGSIETTVIVSFLISLLTSAGTGYFSYRYGRKTVLDKEKMDAAKEITTMLTSNLIHYKMAYVYIEQNQLTNLRDLSKKYALKVSDSGFAEHLARMRLIIGKDFSKSDLDKPIWDITVMSNIDRVLQGEMLTAEEIRHGHAALADSQDKIKKICDVLHEIYFE